MQLILVALILSGLMRGVDKPCGVLPAQFLGSYFMSHHQPPSASFLYIWALVLGGAAFDLPNY
jgi:hypothetical protein